MTPLEVARQLAEMDPIVGFYGCFFCKRPAGHGIDCPVPVLPKIVVALEAAEALRKMTPYNGSTSMTPLEAARNLAGQSPTADGGHYCLFCVGHFQEVAPWQMVHTPGCSWAMLPQIVAALEAAEAVASPYQSSVSMRRKAVLLGALLGMEES